MRPTSRFLATWVGRQGPHTATVMATSTAPGPTSMLMGGTFGCIWTPWWSCSMAWSLGRHPMPDKAMDHKLLTHRFDELAAIVNDRIDDPAEAHVDRYVGLEHLDPGSLTIRRWGSPDDVEATK